MCARCQTNPTCMATAGAQLLQAHMPAQQPVDRSPMLLLPRASYLRAGVYS